MASARPSYPARFRLKCYKGQVMKVRIKLLLAAVSAAVVSTSASAQAAEKVTFLRDVAPILNKVGCTSGTCHGAAKGKNGFKLSLRGYDPEFDYQALLYDL